MSTKHNREMSPRHMVVDVLNFDRFISIAPTALTVVKLSPL